MTLVSLSTPSDLDEINFKDIHEIVAFAPFYRFVQSQKNKDEFISHSQSQIDFIKRYNLDYLIVEPGGIITEKINQLIDTVFTDKPKEYKLIYLKKGN